MRSISSTAHLIVTQHKSALNRTIRNSRFNALFSLLCPTLSSISCPCTSFDFSSSLCPLLPFPSLSFPLCHPTYSILLLSGDSVVARALLEVDTEDSKNRMKEITYPAVKDPAVTRERKAKYGEGRGGTCEYMRDKSHPLEIYVLCTNLSIHFTSLCYFILHIPLLFNILFFLPFLSFSLVSYPSLFCFSIASHSSICQFFFPILSVLFIFGFC